MDILKGNIRGFPGYFISKTGILYRNGKPLKSYFHKGYMRNQLHNGTFRKNIKLHRLVAETYIPNPDNLPVVMHLNDDPTDNRVENLKWGTQKQNVNDAIDKGRLKVKGKDNPMYGVHNYGFKSAHHKLNNRKVRRLYRMYTFGYSRKYIANRLHVCKVTVSNFLKRKHYKF